MSDTEKIVFISYRRDVASFIARAVFQDLRYHSYDVFMDVESIDSGKFDTAILHQIEARAHFLVILTPGTLERCVEVDDWLRREIEHAMDLDRNIVPLLVNNFSFKGHERYLTGKLEQLVHFNALTVPHEYFVEAMERLRTRFLKQPVLGKIVQTPAAEQKAVQQKISEIALLPSPTSLELKAEMYIATGYAKRKVGDLDGAITDYTEAISLTPDNYAVYNKRAVAYRIKGEYGKAIDDYDEAIRLNPSYSGAYRNRGELYFILGSYKKALTDFNTAHNLRPLRLAPIAGMAISQHALGNLDEAKSLWRKLLENDSSYLDPEQVREEFNWAEPLVEEARKLITKL